jgi:hypothetical protein
VLHKSPPAEAGGYSHSQATAFLKNGEAVNVVLQAQPKFVKFVDKKVIAKQLAYPANSHLIFFYLFGSGYARLGLRRYFAPSSPMHSTLSSSICYILRKL